MPLSDHDFMRYSRQILLPEVGECGQQRFGQAHVLIVGVGGLGTLAAQYLAAAGIGKLTLIDGDEVEQSNLPRQLLFAEADIGANKAEVAAVKLMQAYSGCQINSFGQFLTAETASDVFADKYCPIDLLLDCSDSFTVRQLVNRLACEHQLTLVSASAAHFQGQLLSINPQRAADSGCYQCLYPSDMSVSQTCQTIGVLGPMVGTLASMQALMSLNLLLQAEPFSQSKQRLTASKVQSNNLLGKLFRFDGTQFSWRQAALTRDPNCTVCGVAE